MIQKITYLPRPGYFTESCNLESNLSPYSWIPLLLYIWMPIIVRYEPQIKDKKTDESITTAINKKLMDVYATSCNEYNPIIWHMNKSDTLYIPNVTVTKVG